MTKKLTAYQKKVIAENKKYAKEHPVEHANTELMLLIAAAVEHPPKKNITEDELKKISTLLKPLKPDQFSNELLGILTHFPNKSIINLFLKKGLDPNKSWKMDGDDGKEHRESIFQHICHTTNDPEIIELLLNSGATVNQFDPIWYNSPLIDACMNIHMFENGGIALINKIVKILIRHGADVNYANKHGKTPLMGCLQLHVGDVSVVKTLLAAGADINREDEVGNTALVYAIRNPSNPEMVATLLTAGSDVNHKDNNGCTPMMYAARYASNKEIIDALMNAGADIKDPQNWTCAFENPNKEIKEYCFQKFLGITPKTRKKAKAEKKLREQQAEIDRENDKFTTYITWAPLIFTLTYGLFVLKIGWQVFGFAFASFWYGALIALFIATSLFTLLEKKCSSSQINKHTLKQWISACLIFIECYLWNLIIQR